MIADGVDPTVAYLFRVQMGLTGVLSLAGKRIHPVLKINADPRYAERFRCKSAPAIVEEWPVRARAASGFDLGHREDLYTRITTRNRRRVGSRLAAGFRLMRMAG